eukprot:1158130-Pelagomonas_calceolata.AAC.15
MQPCASACMHEQDTKLIGTPPASVGSGTRPPCGWPPDGLQLRTSAIRNKCTSTCTRRQGTNLFECTETNPHKHPPAPVASAAGAA